MDLVNIVLICLMSIIIGAVLMLLIQYYAYIKYCGMTDGDEARRIHYEDKYNLPEDILATMNNPSQNETNSMENNDPTKNSTVAVNLILQFLFFELRHSNKVRKWFHRKLSLELDELITKTTIGRLFDKLSIRDLDLGSQFPEIKTIKVHSVDLHPDEGHIENLDIILNLQYQGNFKLSFDADMVLGKKGFLSVKVKQISGLARLQFTRKPYTHWSLSFLGDPQLDLGVESQFQGRQMQSNVTSLISNQIRKAIRRKHTLPNYKLRYKPFFHRIDDDIDINEFTPDGTLEITVKEITRINSPKHLTHVYCVLTIASFPWVVARQHDDKNLIISLDIEIHKAKNQQIGIVFKQNEHIVLVEAIIPNTPAAKAKLIKGDTLISIEGKKVSHINHVAKIIKSLNRPMFMLRIERSIPGLIKNDAILEDYELREGFSSETLNISFSKQNDSVHIRKLSLRKNSTDKQITASDTSLNDSPTHSPSRKNSKFGHTKSFSRNNSEATEPKSLQNDDSDSFQQHSTIDCEVNSFIRMNDLSSFRLNDTSQYLNLNVYGRFHEEIILLGYLNVSIKQVLYECRESSLGNFLKQYPLTPPDTPNLSTHTLSSQSGFDADLCFGDVLLSFTACGTSSSKKLIYGSTEKLEDRTNENHPTVTQKHDFIRTHFHRSTQCDFCGKKIWLKDAVQCRNCAMCCHKKCVIKCHNSSICGDVSMQPELKVTEPQTSSIDDDFEENDEIHTKVETSGHRQSFSDLLVQGIKRVNSANNLAIPGIVSSLSQSSRSLPPSPQHTPRKQSLATINAGNPFITIPIILENFPESINDLTKEQITELVEPLIGWGTPDDLMSLAKTTSRNLFIELEPKERVDKINNLLSKLRLALDSETLDHANLESQKVSPERSSIQQPETDRTSIRVSSDTTLILQTKGPPSPVAITSAPTFGLQSPTRVSTTESASNSTISINKNSVEHELARRAILLGQSEERVQALSIIMLHLCSGLQYAQGVAGQ